MIMYMLFGIILLVIISVVGISESYAQSNIKQSDFDGAVSSSGCNTIEGTIIELDVDDLGLLQICTFHDKLLRIIDNSQLACTESINYWADPYTDKTYTFTSGCNSPTFCNDVSYSQYGTEYALYVNLDMSYHVIDLGNAHTFSQGSICYQTTSASYQRIQNTFHIITEGQWTENIFELSIPNGLYNNDIHVFVNEQEIEFLKTRLNVSYDEKYPRYITTISFPLEPTNTKYDIQITESPYYDKRFNWDYLVTDELKNELELLINDTPKFSLIDDVELFLQNRLEIIQEIDEELNERGVYILESAEIIDDSIKAILIDSNDKLGTKIIDNNLIDVNPWLSYPPPSARVTDTFGNSLSTVIVDQQVQISDDLGNGKDIEQPFVYLVQIRDNENVTVFLAWISGMLSPGQSFSPSLSWIPDINGIYSVTTFVWKSIDDPIPLRDTHSLYVTVENPDIQQ